MITLYYHVNYYADNVSLPMKQESSLSYVSICCVFNLKSHVGTDGYPRAVSTWHCEYEREIAHYFFARYSCSFDLEFTVSNVNLHMACVPSESYLGFLASN